MHGGHANVIAEIINLNNDKLVGMLDDNKIEKNIIGKICEIDRIYRENENIEFIIAIGNNKIRKEIYEKYRELITYSAVHPSAIISENVKIGSGTMIGAGTIINVNSIIENNCIINTGSIIEHNCYVKEGAHLSYRVTLGAESIVGYGAYIETGSIIDRKQIINDNKHITIGSIIKED